MERKLVYEFGPFRLDPGEHRLERNGERLNLSPQLFSLLLVFVQHSGHLLTGNELRDKLWGNQYVSEDSLKVIVGNLRRALSEGQNGTRYIETVRGKGYRFLLPVKSLEDPVSQPAKAAVPLTRADRSLFRSWAQGHWRSILGVAGLFVLAALSVSARLLWPASPPRVLKFEPLTFDKADKGGPLWTDGTHIYFEEFVADKSLITAVPVLPGEIATIPAPFPNPVAMGILPDGSGLLASEALNSKAESLWKIPLPRGSAQPMENLHGRFFTWSADGQSLAYMDVAQQAVYVAHADGSAPKTIFSIRKGYMNSPAWSPDSKFLRFILVDEVAGTSRLWQINADGADAHPLLPLGWNGGTYEGSGQWTPDGSYFVFYATRDGRGVGENIWALPEKSVWFSRRQTPVRLTDGPLAFSDLTPSRDGKKIFAVGTSEYLQLEQYLVSSPLSAPYLNGISAAELNFSRDGQWVAYTKYPERTIWRSRADGSNAQQLTFPPFEASTPHWSPDGQRIAFRRNLPGQPPKIFIISREGGTPQQLLPDSPHQEEEGVPTWSRDGNSIAFGELRWWPESIAIHVIDLRTRQVSTLAGSAGLWTPRWSPSGRYLLALIPDAQNPNSKGISIFDFETQKWRRLLEHRVHEPYWSRDEKYIFFDVQSCPEMCGIFRVRLSDGKLERVLRLENYRWFGLAPDDSLLVSRVDRHTEIYALHMQW